MDENESMPSISYSSDAPVQDPKDDRFDREPFAHRIAETLIRRQDPASMVIAIYGAWGDGKTTVLNFIRDYLGKEQSVVCVSFNPWRLDGEDALLTGFFATLAEAPRRGLKTRTEKIGDLLKKYSFLPKPLPGVKNLRELHLPLGSIMSSVSLDKLRSQISSIPRESKKRVIVTIDDIDRLEKVEIQAIFRLVKLTADFDYVAYVLAFDEEMAAAAIGEHYSSNASEYHLAGTKFLGKDCAGWASPTACWTSIHRTELRSGDIWTQPIMRRFTPVPYKSPASLCSGFVEQSTKHQIDQCPGFGKKIG